MKRVRTTVFLITAIAVSLSSAAVSNAVTVTSTYDWSTATGSGAGTAIGGNDNWASSSTTGFVLNASQPTGFSGNYLSLSNPATFATRSNNINFNYSISPSATEVTLSLVLNASSGTGLGWMGLNGGDGLFRIGFFSGNWVYRSNDAIIHSLADTGVSAVGAAAKSYKVTVVIDTVADTLDYTVENLTDGGSVLLADDMATEDVDWSVYTGLQARGDDSSFDAFSISYTIPTPAALPAGLAMFGLAAARRRR